MEGMLHEQDSPPERKTSPITILIALIVVVAIALSLWTVLKTPEKPNATIAISNAPATMTGADAAYATSIHIENVALSRAENFLHQEVTILNADAVNAGSQSLANLSVTIEFLDDMNQIVLRETHPILGNPPVELKPAERRSFEISFDRVPASWNYQQPSVRIASLQLTPQK
jgi:hypothetical protein